MEDGALFPADRGVFDIWQPAFFAGFTGVDLARWLVLEAFFGAAFLEDGIIFWAGFLAVFFFEGLAFERRFDAPTFVLLAMVTPGRLAQPKDTLPTESFQIAHRTANINPFPAFPFRVTLRL
jgi:hypothetical protein